MQSTKLLSSVALAAVLVASAGVASVKTGPYAGLNIGYAKIDSKAKTFDPDPTHQAPSVRKKGTLQVNAFAGYETMMTNNLILGGEFTVGMTTSGSKTSFDADAQPVGNDLRAYKIKQDWKTGLFGLLGTPLSDRVTVYGKLGVVYSQFNTQFFNNPVITGAYLGSVSKKNRLWGIEPGVRLNVALTDSISANFDGSYAWYQGSKKVNTVPGAGQPAFLKISPRIWGLTAGVSVKF